MNRKSALITIVSVIIVAGCMQYQIDGKRFATPEAALKYIDHVVLPEQLAEVVPMQRRGGKLLVVLPSNQRLLAPPFLQSTGTLTAQQKNYFIDIYKLNFKAIADGLRKSNMFDEVVLSTTNIKSGGYDYTLECTGRKYVLTNVETGRNVDVGIATGIKFQVEAVAAKLPEIASKKVFNKQTPPKQSLPGNKINEKGENVQTTNETEESIYF